MKKSVRFEYPIRGNGRPQIVLIGNGLERKSGQVAWDRLVDNLTVPDCIPLTDEEKETIPFPLLYEVLVLNRPIPQILDAGAIREEEKCLKTEMKNLVKNRNSTNAGLWHIHGEACASEGIVLGHDRYGRLLKRIIEICSDLDYRKITKRNEPHCFTSWPELFLFGDIYVIGFGFDQSEFDLWWLLRRKQRERYGDGRVFFYDKCISEKERIPSDSLLTPEAIKEDRNIRLHNRAVRKKILRDKLLSAHGVQILDCGSSNETEYDEFYKCAFADVRLRIEESRNVKR